ncbi:helix-turn-helix transcriptional regulator [Legionella spiritensis]|uniref:helix-turn-helix transcriptional regulator n=1 Tax=Legionella spiritensis TaxID=452 RepID=UPI000F6B6198|nr:helix-turn-helix domain-containing protein [Legionella spiritensis]VEG92503.1 Response regulator containing a CheY-like receiver domain and an HTH DNA-binding domain [Legionella spiritensis]
MIELNPSIKNPHVLREISKPLNRIDVAFFGYTAVDAKNNAFCLGSKPDYALEYLKSEYACSDIHFHDTHAKGKLEYNFWDFAELKATTKTLYEMAAKFDQSHTLSIVRHDDNMTHCYHFSGRVHDDGINQRYLDNLNSLHAYIDYFDHCLKTIPELIAVYDHPIPIGHQHRSMDVRCLTSNPKGIDLIKNAAHTLRFNHFYQYYLSKKERNCLYWLKQGKSAEMIASINGVSRKTVERHIASIKKKLDCYTLFQIGVKVGEDGLMDFLLTAA